MKFDRKSSTIILRIILVGIIIAFGGFAVYDIVDDSISINGAEKFVGVPFPESAFNLTLSFNSWLDASLRSKFDMPASDYDVLVTYLRSVCSEMDLMIDFNPFPIDNDWWTPSQAEIYEGGRCRDSQVRHFRVLIDKTNPVIYTVYFTAS